MIPPPITTTRARAGNAGVVMAPGLPSVSPGLSSPGAATPVRLLHVPRRRRDVDRRWARLDQRRGAVQRAGERRDRLVLGREHLARRQRWDVEIELAVGGLEPRDRAGLDQRLEARAIDLDAGGQ